MNKESVRGYLFVITLSILGSLALIAFIHWTT